MSKSESGSPSEATLNILQIIRDKTGDESSAQVLTGGEQYDPEDVLSTGSVLLDYELGNGGWKRGGVVQLFGPEKSGKTSMCLFAMKKDQEGDDTSPIVFLDYENSLDANYMQKLGIDTSRVVVASPETLEEGIEIVKHLLELKIAGDPSAQFSMIVFDSIAEAIPKETVDKSADEESSRAKGPRIWAHQAPIIGSLVRKAEVVFLFTNQARDDQSTNYVKKDKFPGGRALRHKMHTNVRCETFNKDCEFDGKTKEKLVHGMTATIEKNKWSGRSGTKVIIHWVPGERVDNARGLLSLHERVESQGFTDMPLLLGKNWDKKKDEPRQSANAVALAFDEDILAAILEDEPDFDDGGLSGIGYQYRREFIEFLKEHPTLLSHLCAQYLELLNWNEDDEGEWDDEGEDGADEFDDEDDGDDDEDGDWDDDEGEEDDEDEDDDEE